MTVSPWVERWVPLIDRGPHPVLDVACGRGRHTLYLLALGYQVVAVDREPAGPEVVRADLEADPWPFPGQLFAGIVVTNYLHRPLFSVLAAALAPRGVLIYETFSEGQEAYGRPTNPDFLLRPDELLHAFPELSVIAFEQGLASGPAVVQRLCAWRGAAGQSPLLGEST